MSCERNIKNWYFEHKDLNSIEANLTLKWSERYQTPLIPSTISANMNNIETDFTSKQDFNEEPINEVKSRTEHLAILSHY